MKPLRLAVIGFGQVGSACSRAILASDGLSLAGIVRRPENVGTRLPEPLQKVPVVAHASDLHDLVGALICLPTDRVQEAARHLLEHRITVVECATLHGEAFRDHVAEIHRVAVRHKTPAIIGAGWDPGVLSLFRSLFALLAPKGHTQIKYSPGVNLHHTLVARNMRGVKNAMCADLPGPNGRDAALCLRRDRTGSRPGSDRPGGPRGSSVRWAGGVCPPVADVAALEQEGHGVVLEWLGTSGATAHQRFLLEARFDMTALTAQVMLAAARALPTLRPGTHSLFQVPLAALWGDLATEMEKDLL
ncbi:MAG: diaminopimelate dehydrogenase [Candidatus Binatia bacterium]